MALPLTSQSAHSVTLAWDRNQESDVAGYVLRYGLASGSHIVATNVGKVTTHTMGGLAAGVTYYFVVSAYNRMGLEGESSNETSYTPPFWLNVKSIGLPTVPIEIETVDQEGLGDGDTPLVRIYAPSTRVTLIAPETSEGWKFVRWLRNGINLTTQRRITLTLGSEMELTAVYEDDSLQAYWPFEELAGLTTADASGHGHLASLQAGASWDSTPAMGGTLRLDGVDDHLIVEDSADLDFTSHSFTLALWLQTTRASLQTLVQKRSDQGAGLFLISLNRAEDLSGAVSVFNGDRSWFDSQSRDFTDGAWHHLAVSWNGRILRLYHDGQFDSEFEQSVAYQPSTQPLNFGIYFSGSGFRLWPFQGQLDGIRFYNRVLTQEQIAGLVPGAATPQGGGRALLKPSPEMLKLRIDHESDHLRLTILRNDGSVVQHPEGIEILWSDSLMTGRDRWTPLVDSPALEAAVTTPQRFFMLRHKAGY
jgi:hypothetical protein